MTQSKTEQEMVAVDAAAMAMQTTVLNVMMHIKRRLLEGQELDGAWYVSAASLAAFLAQNNRQAAQVVCQTGCAAKKGGCAACG